MSKITNNEQEKFIELCEYVKNEVLELPKECKFPRELALRLRGLHKGQFMANNKCKPNANYTYESILLTFKIHKFDILCKIRQRDNFKDESHRINYMMVVIESKINDVVLKINANKKSEKKAEKLNINIENGAKYTKKTKENNNKKLNDLW